MISVVVPAYNEEEGIGQLYARVSGAAAAWQEDYEILVIDDGSRDRTLELLRGFAGRDPRLKVLSFTRNRGVQGGRGPGGGGRSGRHHAVRGRL